MIINKIIISRKSRDNIKINISMRQFEDQRKFREFLKKFLENLRFLVYFNKI